MIRIIICALCLSVFVMGFFVLLHLSFVCYNAQKAVEALGLMNSRFEHVLDYSPFLGCCIPLGFALIWGSRLYDSISRYKREQAG
jgi:hypothetical protein